MDQTRCENEISRFAQLFAVQNKTRCPPIEGRAAREGGVNEATIV